MTKKDDIIWLDSVDSTNNEARRRIHELDNLSVLSAIEQTAGRGQKGNKWSAAAGENLMFSIVLKYEGNEACCDLLPPVAAKCQSSISEITALSVVNLLQEYGIEGKIKWPNDIYVADRKICGILIEHILSGCNLSKSIVGVGLNVNQKVFDPSIPNPTSMILHSGQTFDLKRLIERFMNIFRQNCFRYLSSSEMVARLREEYLYFLWRLNEPFNYIESDTGQKFTGCIRGLSPIGHLLVEDIEKGELREFAFKEIGYIL